MLFTESVSVLQSFGIILAISSSAFFWRTYSLRKKILKALKLTPTIAVVSSKPDANHKLIKSLGFVQRVRVFKNLYQSENNNFLIELNPAALDIKKLGGINLKRLLYIFDLSSMFQQQVEEFEKIRKDLNVDCVAVVAGVNESEKENLKILEEKFGKVYNLSSVDTRKELEDLKALQESLKPSEKPTIAS